MRHSRVLPTLALLFLVAAGARAHDMFFRLTHYFVSPGDKVRAPLLNGTFSKSEKFHRMGSRHRPERHLARRPHRSRTAPDGTREATRAGSRSRRAGPAPTSSGSPPGPRSWMRRGRTSTSTSARTECRMSSRHVRGRGAAKAVREKYSKHVKAVLQVGDARSGEWATVLGYPAELVPMTNPADLRKGDELAPRCLVDGKPMPGQFVLYGGRGAGESRIEGRSARSGKDGVVRVKFDRPGVWYVKFIRMVPVHDGRVDYESNGRRSPSRCGDPGAESGFAVHRPTSGVAFRPYEPAPDVSSSSCPARPGSSTSRSGAATSACSSATARTRRSSSSSIFLGGMSVGAALAGRRSERHAASRCSGTRCVEVADRRSSASSSTTSSAA